MGYLRRLPAHPTASFSSADSRIRLRSGMRSAGLLRSLRPDICLRNLIFPSPHTRSDRQMRSMRQAGPLLPSLRQRSVCSGGHIPNQLVPVETTADSRGTGKHRPQVNTEGMPAAPLLARHRSTSAGRPFPGLHAGTRSYIDARGGSRERSSYAGYRGCRTGLSTSIPARRRLLVPGVDPKGHSQLHDTLGAGCLPHSHCSGGRAKKPIDP